MLTLQVNIVERMKVIKQVVNLLNKAYQPIKGNASFFLLYVSYRHCGVV